MLSVPWNKIHANVDDFQCIFVFPRLPNAEPLRVDANAWRRAYPYAELYDNCAATTSTSEGAETASVERATASVEATVQRATTALAVTPLKRIRIVGPALRFKQYTGAPTSARFVISALVTLNVTFLHFLETLDSALEARLRTMPEYNGLSFQGLVKVMSNIRVLELPIDEYTDCYVCDRETGARTSVDRGEAMRRWSYTRAPCRPTFRIENWHINPIFHSVRLRIVCESLTFYPGRESLLTATIALDTLAQRHRIYRETGVDIMQYEVLDADEDDVILDQFHSSLLRASSFSSSSLSSTSTSSSSSSSSSCSSSTSEFSGSAALSERLRRMCAQNVRSGWCPLLDDVDKQIAVQWEDENACCICLCNLCNALFNPCAHTCVCIPCAQQMPVHQCPICRLEVARVSRINVASS